MWTGSARHEMSPVARSMRAGTSRSSSVCATLQEETSRGQGGTVRGGPVSSCSSSCRGSAAASSCQQLWRREPAGPLKSPPNPASPEAAVGEHVDEDVDGRRVGAHEGRLRAVLGRARQARLPQHGDDLAVYEPGVEGLESRGEGWLRGRRAASRHASAAGGRRTGPAAAGAAGSQPALPRSLDDLPKQRLVPLAVGVQPEDEALAGDAHQVARERQVPASGRKDSRRPRVSALPTAAAANRPMPDRDSTELAGASRGH